MWACFRVIILLCHLCFHAVDSIQSIPLAQNDYCGKISETEDIRTQVPWTAAIFGRVGSSYPLQFEYQVTGTILGPTVVLTLFGGAFGQPQSLSGYGKYFIPKAEDYIVATGLSSADLNSKDNFTQILEVEYILPWNGHDDQQAYTFFMFHLKQPIDLSTPYAREACIPIFSKYLPTLAFGLSVKPRQSGYHGFGQKKSLVSFDVSLGTVDFCTKKYKEASYAGNYVEHAFCGRTKVLYGNAVCVQPGTAAVAQLHDNRWFVMGVTGLVPSCSKENVYFYGRIRKAMDWIVSNRKCGMNKFPCSEDVCIPLVNACDANIDCPGGEDENPIYCRARKPCIFGDKTFECGVYGKCISQKQYCDGVMDCEAGEDEIIGPNCTKKVEPQKEQMKVVQVNDIMMDKEEKVPKQSYCQPVIEGEGVVTTCINRHGEGISCREAQPFTTALQRCAEFYSSDYRSTTATMTCQEDGSWKGERSLICRQDCGIANVTIGTIFGGKRTTRELSFPWHAAIFKQMGEKFQFICGGSMIERTVIITAAHCVPTFSKSGYKVVLGGNSSMFSEVQKDPEAQIFNVKSIHIPGTYDWQNLQSDIAILELEKPITLTKFVQPVCYLDRIEPGPPPPSTLGKVPGFGFDESGTISTYLKYAEFKVKDCQKVLMRPPVLNTFCAGYENGTAVCQGDSGGGMVFARTKPGASSMIYYLKGIVSHAGGFMADKDCATHTFAVFTHLDLYADWILERIKNLL